ncbi:hypothetical protein C8R47DRAFT_968468 [Mycena vitilis]|nr:hypothetical protein C8R47DRAFT_968468 [Mycena vitilis]
MRRGIWDFIRDQFTPQQPVVKVDLTGKSRPRKTVVVLGANTGLGFEAAKHFATMNPGRLILACRNHSRGQAAVEPPPLVIRAYPSAELWVVDLADFSSVKQFTDRFEREGGGLDILMANAAILMLKYEPTTDGWETAFVLAVLSSLAERSNTYQA